MLDASNDRKQPTRGDLLLAGMLMLAAATVALACGRALLLQREQARVNDYAALLLAHANQVSGDVAQGLHRLRRSRAVACSDQDLDEARRVLFASRFLRDIGRLDGNAVACSALWGRLPDGHRTLLPSPDLDTGTYRMWHAKPTPIDASIVADLTAMGDAVVTTAPTAFASVEQVSTGIGAVLRNRDGSHVFATFGSLADADDALTAWRCSDVFDFCVDARLRRPSPLAQSPLMFGGLALLGFLAGGGIAAGLIAARLRHHSLSMQLPRALALGGRGLALRYQPLRTLDGRHLRGVEALVRWRSEDGEWISPDTFVPLVEQMGRIGELSRHVVRDALDELQERLRDDSGFYVSLNLSVHDILDRDFHHYLDRQARMRGVAAARIVLEITERSTAAHGELAEGIRDLRERGFRLYVDDFGTGYSSLAYLAKLPIDAIKLDRSFTAAIGTDSPVESIIGPICELAHGLGVTLVVEGVEQELQAERILQLSPDALGQGWLLGRPLAAAELPAD